MHIVAITGGSQNHLPHLVCSTWVFLTVHYVLFRAAAAFWGFIDDLSVGLSCSGASVILNAQSEQRFGTLDANVN
eukprot:13523-Eustigmatos_ZCMA.PRE.1